jgi:hypothetical protein
MMWLPFTSRTLMRAAAQRAVQHLADPRAGRVRDRAGVDDAHRAVGKLEPRFPCVADALRRHELGAREDLGAALLRVERVQHHETRVVDPAVRIDEAALDRVDQRRAGRVAAHVDAARAGQQLAFREVIVEKQADADQPRRPQVRHVRHHEAQRPHDVRRRAQQRFTLLQRLADEAELVVFEVAQAAVNQLRAARRRVRRQIVLLAKQHRQAAARRIARDAGAVDAAADDEQIVAIRLCHLLSLSSDGNWRT